MIAEGLKELAQQTKKAMTPVIVPLPDGADPRVGQVFYPSTDTIADIPILPPHRAHSLLTLLSLANAVTRFASSDRVSLWCSMERVVALCDDGIGELPSFRRDRLEFTLGLSPLWNVLANIGTKAMDQKACYRMFKHEIATASLDPAGFVDIVSSMRFDSSQQIAGEVSNVGKNTFGKSVMAEARGAAELPEEIDIAFDPWPSSRVWETPFLVVVTCSVFVDAVAGTFSIVPQPGEIAVAKCKALDALCLRVAEVTAIPSEQVFAGTP